MKSNSAIKKKAIEIFGDIIKDAGVTEAEHVEENPTYQHGIFIDSRSGVYIEFTNGKIVKFEVCDGEFSSGDISKLK